MYQPDFFLLETLGEILKELREESGLTQRQAAKKALSTQARLSDIENGKADVMISTIQRWAKVYGYELEIKFNPIGTLDNMIAEAIKEQENVDSSLD